jgi:hypothetical protein
MLAFEEAAIHQYADLVGEESIDCDLHITRAFDVCFTEDGAKEAKADWKARRDAFPQQLRNSDVRIVEEREALERVTGIKGGYWGASYVAGHLWPYKLATACKSSDAHVDTYTDWDFSNTYMPQARHESPNVYSCNIDGKIPV